jgi:hypothetical protein
MSELLELKYSNEWNRTKEAVIIQLTDFADLIDKRHHYLCFSRITCNTVSTIGSGMLITGLALAPVTAGASLPIIAVMGGIIGFVGNSVGISCAIYENIAERLDLRKTKELIEEFNHTTEAMLSREASVYWNFMLLITPCLSAYGAVKTYVKFVQVFDAVSDTAETGGALFTKALCTSGTLGRVFGRFALHASLALNSIGIVLDTLDSGLAAVDIYKTQKSLVKDVDKPSNKVRQFITKFKTLDFEEIESRFVKFNAGVSIINRGRFKARFSITYLIGDSKITAVATEAFKRKQVILKEFNIPKVGACVVLKVEISMVSCRFLWRVIFKKEIEPPYFKIFELNGNKLFPRIKEITSNN